MSKVWIKRTLSVAIIGIFILSGVFSSTAKAASADQNTSQSTEDESSDYYGRLSAIFLGDGTSKSFRVFVKGERLYVDVSSLADNFSMPCSFGKNNVQILCRNDKVNGALIIDFKKNSRSVHKYDGNVNAEKYRTPYKCIHNDEGFWIPFKFAINMMGADCLIYKDVLYISSFHESLNAIAISAANGSSSVTDKCIAIRSAAGKSQSPAADSALESELTKNKWLYELKPDLELVNNKDADAELATYLISNVSPEGYKEAEQYYELENLYVIYPMMEVLEDNGTDIFSMFDHLDENECKNMIEQAAANAANSNPEAKYSDAYQRAYKDLAGYDPVSGKWDKDSQKLLSFVQSLISYKGRQSEVDGVTMDLISDIPTFGNEVMEIGPTVISGTATITTYAWNSLAQNRYASEQFDKFLKEKGKKALTNNELYSQLRDRIDNYNDYVYEPVSDFFNDTIIDNGTDDGRENFLKGYLSEQKTDKVTNGLDMLIFGIDCIQYNKKIDEAMLKDYINAETAYLDAVNLTEQIQYSMKREKPDIGRAYIFYKSDYVANFYLLKVLQSEKSSLSEDQKETYRSQLQSIIDLECSNMAAIQIGIDYGLTKSQNAKYNKAYDDSKYIPLVEELFIGMGNTNGNMNAGGLVTISEHYIAYSEQGFADDNRIVHIKNREGNTEIDTINDLIYWLNLYEDGDNAYLYFVNNNKDICSYNINNKQTSTIATGSYQKLMIDDGCLYYVSDNGLYRCDLINGLADMDSSKQLCSDVGSCICYSTGGIYYSNTSGEICKINRSDFSVKPLGIFSNSFDLGTVAIYYVNANDSKKIYSYNLLNGTSKEIGERTDCNLLIVYHGNIYYKVINGYDDGLVYMLNPVVNVDHEIVYAIGLDGDSDDNYSYNSPDSKYYQWSTLGNRIFNIADGQIYNEGGTFCFTSIPSNGISFGNLVMKIVYSFTKVQSE